MMRQVVPALYRHAARLHGSPAASVLGCRQFCRGYRHRPGLWDLWRGESWGWPGRLMEENAKAMRRMMDELHDPRWFPAAPWWRNDARVSETGRVQVHYDNKIYRIKLDMSDYTPEEIKVKIVDDKIVLTARREKTADEYGFHSREMIRQFLIPENVDMESISCRHTAEQELVISGKVTGSENTAERVLNIEREEPTKNDDKKKE